MGSGYVNDEDVLGMDCSEPGEESMGGSERDCCTCIEDETDGNEDNSSCAPPEAMLIEEEDGIVLSPPAIRSLWRFVTSLPSKKIYMQAGRHLLCQHLK